MLASQRSPLDPYYMPEFRVGNRVIPDQPAGVPNPVYHKLLSDFAADNQMTGSAQPLSSQINPATGWPMFNTEADRNAAVDSGAFNPEFATPHAQTLYQQMTKSNFDNAAALQAAQISGASKMFGRDPSHANLVGMQLAGDSGGDVKRVLQSLQPRDVMVNPGDLGGVEQLQPYNYANYGGSPTKSDGINPRLDKAVVDNSYFQDLLRTDPKKAAFVYQRLTGRAYEGDVEAYSSLQKATGKADFDFMQRQIESGAAQLDTKTGRFTVWNRVMPPEGGGGLGGGSTQPQMKLGLANADQQAMMERAYSATHQGKKFSRPAPMSKADQAFISAQDKGVAGPQLAAMREKLGRDLNKDEVLYYTTLAAREDAARMDREGTIPTNRNLWGNSEEGWGTFPRAGAALVQSMLGLKPVAHPEARTAADIWAAMQDDSQQSPLLNATAPLAWPMAGYRAARNWWNAPPAAPNPMSRPSVMNPFAHPTPYAR